MPWYIFAVATPTFYSLSNFIDKFLLEKKIKNPILMTAISGIASSFIGVLIGLVTGFKNIGINQTILIIFAGILLIFYLLPYFEALKIEDASRIVPLFQFIPVFTLILSSVFLKETLTNRQIIGLVLVVVSGILLSVKKIEGGILKPRKSLWFMLLASLMYGAVGILFRLVVKDVDFWTALSYEYMGIGVGGAMLFLLPGIRKRFKKDIKPIKDSSGVIILNNGLAIVAQVSESYAISLVAVPLVNIIGSIQPLITLVEGILLTLWFPHLIKEDIRKLVVIHKLISILLIFIGLYLVYF